MRILYALAEKGEAMNFTEFKRLVGSPTTTSHCLRSLVQAGLVDKEIQADRYRSVKYSLTKKGARVAKLVWELERALYDGSHSHGFSLNPLSGGGSWLLRLSKS